MEVVSFVFRACERPVRDARNARERRLSKKPRRRRNAHRGRIARRRRRRRRRRRTKVDETRGILVCGHSRCLQPTIMIIAPES